MERQETRWLHLKPTIRNICCRNICNLFKRLRSSTDYVWPHTVDCGLSSAYLSIYLLLVIITSWVNCSTLVLLQCEWRAFCSAACHWCFCLCARITELLCPDNSCSIWTQATCRSTSRHSWKSAVQPSDIDLFSCSDTRGWTVVYSLLMFKAWNLFFLIIIYRFCACVMWRRSLFLRQYRMYYIIILSLCKRIRIIDSVFFCLSCPFKPVYTIFCDYKILYVKCFFCIHVNAYNSFLPICI